MLQNLLGWMAGWHLRIDGISKKWANCHAESLCVINLCHLIGFCRISAFECQNGQKWLSKNFFFLAQILYFKFIIKKYFQFGLKKRNKNKTKEKIKCRKKVAIAAKNK